MSSARLSGADMSKCVLVNTKLSNADLSGTELFCPDHRVHVLFDTLFVSNQICGRSVSHAGDMICFVAIVSGADFSNATLRDADMSKIVLVNTKLHNVDLSGRDLSGVNMSGADLSGTAR